MKSQIEEDFELLGQKKELASILLGLLIFIALISQGHNDPTPLNLIWPHEGLSNWLGLPGTLFAGLLLNLFGWTAYIIPLLMIFILKATKKHFLYSSLQNILFIFLFNMIISLAFYAESQLLPPATGLWGVITHLILSNNPGKWPSLILLFLLGVNIVYNFRFNRLLPDLIFKCMVLAFLMFMGFWQLILIYFNKFFSFINSISKQFWDNVLVLKYRFFGHKHPQSSPHQDANTDFKSMDQSLNILEKTKSKANNITSILEDTLGKAIKKTPKTQNQKDLIKQALNEYNNQADNNIKE